MFESAPASANVVNRLLSGPFGTFMLRPWYDPVALQGVVRFFMPTSRAWAAANTAGTDIDAFLLALGKPRSVGANLKDAIAETQHRRAVYQSAEAAWEHAAFSNGSAADVVAAEERRMAAADYWMRARLGFMPTHLINPFSPVKFEVEPPPQVEARHGARLLTDGAMFAGAGDIDGIQQSPPCDIHGRCLSWVRFPAGPNSGDTVGYARVEEPRLETGSRARGAVVFCHGIMMEREHWASLYDQAEVFLEPEQGALAVISPEGPFHGRRLSQGTYGGEPILARGVGGVADYFGAHVVEVGRLIAWARKTYGGPVAVAGVSLGALTAQLVVSAAKHWPIDARPDAALLLTTNESMIDVAFNGSLAGGLGFPEALKSAGWTPAHIDRFRPLVEPGEPAIDPQRIVCVLGTTDTVTPYSGGQRLAARWRLPDTNVFHWHGGHFAAAFSVLRDRTPIHRLKEAMNAA
jgi:hypothetical protein